MSVESKSSNWPRPELAPDPADLSLCVHCGLCITVCPTFVLTGLELESPRGRIHLAKSVADGRIPLTAAVAKHWELCLQCRACEPACPSGVPFGRIIEGAKAQLDAKPPRQKTQRRVRRFLLRNVLARPAVLRIALAPLRSGPVRALRAFARRTGLLRLVPVLARGEAQLPTRGGHPVRAGTRLPGSAAHANQHALLFTGCIMGEMFGDVHRATARVLMRRGVALTAISDQLCCGALNAHDGDLSFAKKLARKNIAVFERHEGDIVVNSAGCGAAMKEYRELLSDDADWAERATAFSARVVDFSELAARLPGPEGATFDGTVAYQDPCHLANVQGVRDEPRALLGQVSGCELLPDDDGMCCGAAGLYSVLEPETAGELRERKEERFSKLRPDVIVTANPGCQMQYEAAVRNAGLNSRVLHLAEFLDEAEESL